MLKRSVLVLTALLVLPLAVLAQGTNEGATVTAPFLVEPPTIDGQISEGEWDAAAVAPGDWSEHNSTNPEDPNFPTTVSVAYGIQGLYILFECTDDEVLALAGGSEFLGSGPAGVEGQGQPFGFGGATDYLAIYVDPSNYANGNPSENLFSYSIQTEPGVTANGADASYTYTEIGQFGGFAAKLDPPIENADGVLQYWAGGVSWEASGMEVVDGPTEDGYAMEYFIPWTVFTGYTTDWASVVDANLADVRQEPTDPFFTENAIAPGFKFGEDGTAYSVGLGQVSGMPLPGSEWKLQLARYTETASAQYTNWVGDTGGFASRPFGNLVFGDAPATAVREAMMHINN